MLVALPDDLVQIDRLVADQRAQPEVVDDEQRRRGVAQHLAVVGPSARAARSWVSSSGALDVEHVVARTTCALTERLRDVRLADAGASDEQHVLVALDEAACREVDDLRLRDLGLKAKSKSSMRPRALEARAAQPHVELLAVAAFTLVGEQPVEKLTVR